VIDGTKGPFDQKLTPGPSDATWLAQALSATLLASYADAPADPAASLARKGWRVCPRNCATLRRKIRLAAVFRG
jgi:hypothetical protein